MKRMVVFLLFAAFLLSFSACGASEGPKSSSDGADADASETTTYDSSQTSSDDSGEVWVPAQKVRNLVMVGDGYNNRIVVYDLDVLSPGDPLELAEEWVFPNYAPGGMKYREGTVFGDVIVATSGSQRSALMIEYPGKRVLWETNDPGNNPHSIEILPGGNVVVASSTGNSLRLFAVSSLLKGDTETSQTYKEYELTDAHGVLWDPEYQVLWALGGQELVAYRVVGDGADQELVRADGMGTALPRQSLGGHDLSADFSDVHYLYLTTNENVFRFNKKDGTLDNKFEHYAKLNKRGVKGFGNNPNGNFVYVYPNGGKDTLWEDQAQAAWCSDRIYFCYWKTEHLFYVQTCQSERNAAFYKARIFYGQYQ